MKNRKEILIETLHGSSARLKDIPDLIKEVNIYNESGCIDSEFFMECLININEFMSVSNMVISAITDLLGPCSVGTCKTEKKDDGKKWSVEEILKHSTLEDNILKLPNVQFNKKSYAEAKKWIEEAGGSWTGGKVQGFTFPFNADRVFSILHEGKRCNLRSDFQFFATPPEVADWLVSLVGVSKEDKILEPSAGTGAIVDAIMRSCPECAVDCFELMPENKEQLMKKDGVNILGDDFLQSNVGGYTRIIANPPFSGNQDIDHVLEMYGRLSNGGKLAAIMSRHWTFADEQKCADFRQFLDNIDAHVIEISEKEFKSSGTNIATIAVVIEKK